MAEDDTTTDDTTTDDTPKWDEKWRETWAGDDEAKLKHIGRFASPTAAFDGGYAANLKIASGEYKQAVEFPVKGSDEEKADWRKTNGIPEAADKYDLGEIDDNLKTAASQRAFEGNLNPGSARTMVDFHNEQLTLADEAQTETDLGFNETTEDELRSEWGNEYRANINKINGLLDTAPEGVKEDILGARLASGKPLGSDVNALKFLIDLALIQNPTTTIVPDGGNMIDSINDEIDAIKAKMGTKEYTNSEKMQARYRELIAVRDKGK